MPALKITYKDLVLFDGEVDEFTWADAPGGISVVGKTKPARNAASGGAGLLELLGRGRQPQPHPEPAEETA